MIVVAELDADLFAGFAGAIEEIRGAFPAAWFDALFFVNPRANDVVVAYDFGGLQSLGPLFFDDVVANVARRRGQAILVDGVAHGVELHADAVNVMCGVRSPGWLGGGCESCGDGSADKCASIHGRHFTPSEREGKRDSVKKKGGASKGAALLAAV